MANRAYLIRSDFHDIYPSLGCPYFNRKKRIVANGANQIPLLWIPLFRIDDLRVRQLPTEGGLGTNAEALLIEADRAALNLELAIPMYVSLFPELTGLSSEASVLLSAIASFSGRYLTIEWDELELDSEGHAIVRQQLEFLTTPTIKVAPLQRRMFERFRRPQSQDQLRRELLAYHSILINKRIAEFVPDLTGEPYLTDWPSDQNTDIT